MWKLKMWSVIKRNMIKNEPNHLFTSNLISIDFLLWITFFALIILNHRINFKLTCFSWNQQEPIMFRSINEIKFTNFDRIYLCLVTETENIILLYEFFQQLWCDMTLTWQNASNEFTKLNLSYSVKTHTSKIRNL